MQYDSPSEYELVVVAALLVCALCSVVTYSVCIMYYAL